MIEVDIEQSTPEHFEMRRGIPTGSSFKNIITPARGGLSKSINKYIGKIIAGETSPEDQPGFSTYWTERGIDMEPEARAWYEMKTGFTVSPGGIIFNDDKTVAVSPDGKIGTDGLLEIKCLSPEQHIAYYLDWEEAGSLPNEFLPQVHGQLGVSERKWLDFLMYCPGYKEVLIRVIPNEYTKSVMQAVAVFSESLIRAKGAVIK